MNKSFVFFCLLLLFPLLNYATTTIRCSNEGYAGKTLQFYRFSDPVSHEKELVFTLVFDANGKCTQEINVKQTTYVFSEFGVYSGMLLVEPGSSIDVKLPPFREKSFANQKNPYFTPVEFWFISEDENNLNNKISKFEQKLNYLNDKYFNQLYYKQSRAAFDTIQAEINNTFSAEKNKTFLHHKALQLQLMETDIFQLRPEKYSEIFNNIEPEYWQHQAFITSFEKTFDNQLSFSAKAIKGKEVDQAVETKNIEALLNFTKKKYKVSGKMAELVLLKLLHDGFYSNDFSQSAIKELVANKIFTTNTTPEIAKAAKNTLTKFSFLQKKSVAPEICLSNLNGQKQCTNSNKSKFKYIVFADAETPVCQEHLKYLTRIEELFSKNLEIFVVLRNTEKSGIQKFFAENKVPGVKMIDSENTVSEKYKIRSYPQCFLFDEEHRVVFSDTKSPLDGFEQQFGPWLRKQLFMRQRNQSR